MKEYASGIHLADTEKKDQSFDTINNVKNC